MAATVHCDGQTYPLDFESIGSAAKAASFLAELAKTFITKAKQCYSEKIVGLVPVSESGSTTYARRWLTGETSSSTDAVLMLLNM